MFRKKRIYLDAAAGPHGNPSSPHAEGRKLRDRLERSRTEIARLIECKANDVVLTSGATEANALAILGLAKPGAHFLYLPSAHASIVENMIRAEERGVSVEPLSITDGNVDIEKLKSMLRPETTLVSMDAVCGETGTIWDTRAVKQAIGDVWLHVDASQAPLTQKISRSHFGADLLVLDGGKLGAPGAGALIAHRTIPLVPLYSGGGQERGLRSGTENVEAIERFALVFSNTTENREAFLAHAATLRTKLLEQIETISNHSMNGGRETVPHIVNLSFPGRDTDYLVALLDEAGFAVSTRSACETDSVEGSRAVFALTGDRERALSTLRISFGTATSERDITRFARALGVAVAFVDSPPIKAHH